MKTLVLTLLPIICFAQKDGEWKTFDQPQYSIQYPSDWELNEHGQMGASFFLFSPKKSEADQFRENVNLIIQDLTSYNIDLDQYAQISEEQIKTLATNSRILENKRMKNEAGEYQEIIYTGDQGIFNLQYMQHYWVINGMAYVLTFTAEQSEFSRFEKTAKKIFASFVINK